jgi:putative ATP-binding cassette transporter
VRFGRAIRTLATSDVGRKAIALFVLLIAFLLGINGLNVVNSYIGRYFMTAIERRSMQDFLRWDAIYIGVFGASTVVAVVYRSTEERLALLWRVWISGNLVRAYMGNRTYFRLDAAGELANPDQRIADDTRAFTATTISFVLLILNSTLTIVAFAGVLWSISPLLFGVAVGAVEDAADLRENTQDRCDAVLALAAGGAWTWQPIVAGHPHGAGAPDQQQIPQRNDPNRDHP